MAAHDFWTDRLSDHLDGHLTPDEARAVEEHLAACPDCHAVAKELDEVRRRARALGGIAPPADLWSGIRARLSAADDVVDLTLRLDPPPRLAEPIRRRRSTGVLRAAAMAGLLVGAGAGGWALRAAAFDADRPSGAVAASSAARPVADVAPGAPEEVAREVASLVQLLDGASAELDPNTLRVLKKNLAVIQTAVAESRAALEADPENAWVRRHLEGAVERQRQFVRQATRLLEADD